MINKKCKIVSLICMLMLNGCAKTNETANLIEEVVLEEIVSDIQFYVEEDLEEDLVDKVDETSLDNELLNVAPILMLHHFDNGNRTSAVVDKEDFITYLDYLDENNYNTLTMKDLYSIKLGDMTLPENPIFITADDGYLSNYDFMYPELKKRNMKATIFPIGKSLDDAQNDNLYDWEIPKFNWTQAKEMVDSGLIDIQLHTYDSHNKTPYNGYEKGDFSVPIEGESDEDYRDRIDKDLKLNIEVIEKHLGYTPVAFAYPFGEYSEISEEVLKDNGIEISLLVSTGKINIDDSLYLLNRINVSGNEDLSDLINNLNTSYKEFEEMKNQ